MADKNKDPAEQLRQMDIKDFDLTSLEKMFSSVLSDPDNKGLKELADYTEREAIPQRIIFNAYENASKLSFALNLAAVAAEWNPKEQEALLNLLRTYKETGKLSKEDLLKLTETQDEEKAQEIITEMVQSRPAGYDLPTAKIHNLLFDHTSPLTDKVEGIRGVISKQGEPEKFAYIYLEEDENIKGLENLTEFDKSVHNAVISMFNETGERIFTARQVTQFLFYGNDYINRATPEQIEKVDKSIKKLMRLQVTINFEEQAQLYNLNLKSFELSRYILPLDIIKIKLFVNGEEVEQEAYSLIVKPPILEYVQRFKQLTTIETRLLDVPIRSNPENVVIRDYLLSQIAIMKNNKGKNNRMSNYDTIVIDGLIKESGIDLDKYKTAQSKAKKRKSVINSITKLLDTWKAKEHIKSYRVNKGGSGKRKDSIYSITINV